MAKSGGGGGGGISGTRTEAQVRRDIIRVRRNERTAFGFYSTNNAPF